MTRPFKYQSYLNKYKNCPRNCTEKEIPAFRWVHETPTVEDFCPILLMPGNEGRAIDDTDKMCTGYALSLFKDSLSATTAYKLAFNRLDKPTKREKFKQGKGTATVQIKIKKDDGVSDEPKSDGHFNFFEYEGSDLFSTISLIIDNFA